MVDHHRDARPYIRLTTFVSNGSFVGFDADEELGEPYIDVLQYNLRVLTLTGQPEQAGEAGEDEEEEAGGGEEDNEDEDVEENEVDDDEEDAAAAAEEPVAVAGARVAVARGAAAGRTCGRPGGTEAALAGADHVLEGPGQFADQLPHEDVPIERHAGLRSRKSFVC